MIEHYFLFFHMNENNPNGMAMKTAIKRISSRLTTEFNYNPALIHGMEPSNLKSRNVNNQ